MQSYNGVKVNNERINGKVPLGDGDVIVIGDYRLSIKQDKAEASPCQPLHRPCSKRQARMLRRSPILHCSLCLPDGASAQCGAAGRQVAGEAGTPDRRFVELRPPRISAGKAAMVIGRTDDNDIVLNHRSISRHHAKIVREGDHYHVVDLQSANGVRVNGEDYNKVELRKGDQIDLGHVRSIFVPPGQDIDIRDKIVDLDGGRSPAMTIGMVVLLLAIVGGGIYWFQTAALR